MKGEIVHDEGVVAIIGGQYGSEGKGLAVSKIWHYYRNHVRVGAANAGHTGWIDNRKLVSQQLPMAAWATSQKPNCYIGPGAVISLDILKREIEETGIESSRLFIDYRAHVITDDQIEREGRTDLADRIGSTSTIAREGIGTATSDRVMRSASCVTVDEVAELAMYAADVPFLLSQEDSILLEGTQGTGLSLTTGQFPYTTSRNTTATGLMADAGVPANRLDRSIGVFRTYPIRVAGNSGPFFPDSHEIDFNDLGVEPERTTVTKLKRRVATWSHQQLEYSAMLNGMTHAYVTFLDYEIPALFGKDSFKELEPHDMDKVDTFVGRFSRLGIELMGFGTGPQSLVPMKDYLYGQFA
jgi:adenylosuccinate synthase